MGAQGCFDQVIAHNGIKQEQCVDTGPGMEAGNGGNAMGGVSAQCVIGPKTTGQQRSRWRTGDISHRDRPIAA
jgi:hypothetical protein